MIGDLDAYRVGWELIDHARYSYYGGMRGVVIQFSRGCPHLCTFCGQRGFWTRWRHRDPVQPRQGDRAAQSRARRQMISFADENPTTSKKAWRALLEAIIAENLEPDDDRDACAPTTSCATPTSCISTARPASCAS